MPVHHDQATKSGRPDPSHRSRHRPGGRIGTGLASVATAAGLAGGARGTACRSSIYRRLVGWVRIDGGRPMAALSPVRSAWVAALARVQLWGWPRVDHRWAGRQPRTSSATEQSTSARQGSAW
jgi:hypothetical protein